MLQTESLPRGSERGWLWLLKVASGALIIILIGVHFVVNHFVAEGGLLTYADVIRYYQNPLIPLMEIIFLVCVVSHSLIGLRGIVLDLHPSPGVLRVVDRVFILFGAGAIIYGIWLALAIASQSV